MSNVFISQISLIIDLFLRTIFANVLGSAAVVAKDII